MPIQVTCSNCEVSYSVPDTRAGQTGRCKCGQYMVVPGRGVQSEPPLPPAAGAAATEVPLPPVIEEAEVVQQGQVRCPHCGMESQPGLACEWCNQDLLGAAEPGGQPPAAPPQARVAPTARWVAIHRVDLVACLRTAAVLAVVPVLALQAQAYALRVLGGLLGAGRGFTAFRIGGAMRGTIVSVLFALAAALIGTLVVVGAFNLVARLTNGFRIRLREPVSWAVGTRELARISPLWALVVGALSGAFAGLAAATLFVVLMQGLRSALRGAMPSPDLSETGQLLVIVPLWYALVGGISMAASSLIYNVIAPMWGGIGFEAEPLQEASGPGQGPLHAAAEGRVRVRGIDVLRSGLVGAIAWLVAVVAVSLLMLLMGGPPSLRVLVGNVIFAFIVGLVAAGIYNLVGLLTGGLEVETRG